MPEDLRLLVPLVFLGILFLAVFIHPKPRGPEKPDPKHRKAWISTKGKPRFWWYR